MNLIPSISIVNGHIIDPANDLNAVLDLHLQNGKIAAIGPAPAGFTPAITIQAANQIVCPGLIDLAVRLREPGQEYKATIATETAAAVASGITTLCAMPDTNPVTDTPAVVELIRQRAESSAKARVLPIAALTRGLGGDILSDMAALRDAGCVAISNIDRPLKNALLERRALEYAATFGLICIVQPIDNSLKNQGCVHEGRISAKLGLPGIPEAAETVALTKILILAAHAGAQVHFHALSSAAGISLFSRSQYQNSTLTADVAIHNLHLTEDDVENFNTNCHVMPPLRSHADREALRRAVADGKIIAICSDHQPHEPDAKTNPFPATAPGISGLDTLLPLTLRLVDEKIMNLNAAIERLTWGPARCLGLPFLGCFNIGNPADVCIFDPNSTWEINTKQFLSHGHNTPFHGWSVRGRVNWTLVDGRIVFTRGNEN